MRQPIVSLAGAMITLLLSGCQGSVIVIAGDDPCPEDQRVGAGCVGLLPAHACHDEPWLEGVRCDAVRHAGSDTELATELANAQPGECIDLDAGSYQAVTIPAGLQLLGRGHECVTLSGASLAAGQGTRLRGVTVEGGGIQVEAVSDGRIDWVRVQAATDDGIHVEGASSLTIAASEITGSSRYGVVMFAPGRLRLERTLVDQSSGPGLWAQCTEQQGEACACADALTLELAAVRVRDSKLVGVSAVGAQVRLRDVEVRDGTVDDHFQPSAGISVSECSHVRGTGLRVVDNTNFGVLMTDSSAELGAAGEGRGLEIGRNLRGAIVEMFGTPSARTVRFEQAAFEGNTGVGLLVKGAAGSFECTDCSVRNTALVALPVLVDGVSAGSQEVGDGFGWCDQATVRLDGLAVDHSARASVLIDGAVGPGSHIANVSLTGGDESLGIVQQSLPPGGPQPEIGPGVPELSISTATVWPTLCGQTAGPPG